MTVPHPDAVDMARIHALTFADTRPWTEAEFASFLAQPTCFAVGDTRAFALVRAIVDEAELLTIATDPDHQRLGLARNLMIQWHNLAAAQGVRRVFLEVAANNTAALALYRHLGYRDCGVRQAYYRRAKGPPVDAIVMECTLTTRQPGKSLTSPPKSS